MILALDTSGGELLVCLLSDDLQLVAGRAEPGVRHQEVLLDVVSEVLGGPGGARQLTAIAVVRGPGSQTGLRVGLAAAEGLAFGSRLRLLPLSSLAVAAHRQTADGNVVAAVSAGRRNVYAQLFSGIGNRRVPAGDRVLAPAAEVRARLGVAAGVPLAVEPSLLQAFGEGPMGPGVDGVTALANAAREGAEGGDAVAYHQLTGDYGE